MDHVSANTTKPTSYFAQYKCVSKGNLILLLHLCLLQLQPQHQCKLHIFSLDMERLFGGEETVSEPL